jgi:hypothetical protein
LLAKNVLQVQGKLFDESAHEMHIPNVIARALYERIRDEITDTSTIIENWLPYFLSISNPRLYLLIPYSLNGNNTVSAMGWLLPALKLVAQQDPWLAIQQGTPLFAQIANSQKDPHQNTLLYSEDEKLNTSSTVPTDKHHTLNDTLSRDTVKYLLRLLPDVNHQMGNNDVLRNYILIFTAQTLLTSKLFQTRNKGTTIANHIAEELFQDLVKHRPMPFHICKFMLCLY